jgi:hypothetical protein
MDLVLIYMAVSEQFTMVMERVLHSNSQMNLMMRMGGEE